jgi:hypothetical protein
VGRRAIDFTGRGVLFPFYSLKIFFGEANFAAKIAKNTKIKLFICNGLRVFEGNGTGCQVPWW